ncbi:MULTISPECIES: rhomboid family intramembrane serine protease [Plantibacter]|uniref:rhomboid family intramembrane serine protease n=1 Tax=Plantibacter TaxID=190323 RepID=UPI001F0B63D1|nr:MULTISPECIES: rhomboid family intramembrane serine protease [Plantibacter]
MKAQRQSAPRNRLGARISNSSPIVTYAIIAVTAFVFLLQWIPGLGVTNALLYAGVYSDPSYGAFQPWRMLTAVFVHSQGFIFHILLNMYTLWIFGRILETMLGHWRFLALYLVAGFAGSVGVLFLADPTTAVVGASGAIFGLLGAFLVIQRRMGADTRGLLVLLGINLVIGFIPGVNIAWQAHLGGLVGGALVGLILVNTRKRTQQPLQAVLIGALSVVLLGASLLPALL